MKKYVVYSFQTLRPVGNDAAKARKQSKHVRCEHFPVLSSLRGKYSIAHGHYVLVRIMCCQGAHLSLRHHSQVGTVDGADFFKVLVDLEPITYTMEGVQRKGKIMSKVIYTPGGECTQWAVPSLTSKKKAPLSFASGGEYKNERHMRMD